MDPRQWIYGFIDHLPGFLKNPLHSVADRVFSILDDGVTFAKWIKSGVAYWYTYALALASTLVTLGAEVVTTATWLVKTFIPQRIAAAIDAVKKWVSPIITAALNTAKSLINDLRTFAVAQINKAINLVNTLRDWALGQLNALKDKITKTVDVWFDRLTHPEKMVAWILAPLITALLAYIYGKREQIAQWLLRSSPAFTTWLASTIEKVLVKIL